MGLRFDLNEHEFLNDGAPDEDGITWLVTGIDGWDSPDLRQASVEPTSRHGSRLSQSMLAPRALVLKGLCKATTESQYWAARDFLNGLMNNLWYERELTVHEATIKTINVIRAGAVRMSEPGKPGINTFEWEMPLLAQDPLKYGAAVTTAIPAGATRTLTNVGNFPTEKITVTTSGTVILTANAKSLRAAGVPSSTVFDMYDRTILKAGVSHFDKLSSISEWFDLQPGANSVVNGGSASASVTFRPAWL